MSPGIEEVESPEVYTPVFCNAIRNACADHQKSLQAQLSKMDGRLFTVFLAAVGNLVTALGACMAYIIFK